LWYIVETLHTSFLGLEEDCVKISETYLEFLGVEGVGRLDSTVDLVEGRDFDIFS